MKKYIWDGIYADMSEVPAAGGGYESDSWIRAAATAEAQTAQEIGFQAVNRESLLPFLVALLGSGTNRVTVIDYGGGFGKTYRAVIGAQQQSWVIDYHIVELPGIAKAGTKLFQNDSRIVFHNTFPDLPSADIVHIESSLQYIPDWKGTLKRLCTYVPKFLHFTDLPAGNIPTYATVQNFHGSRVPYRFYNLGEVVAELQANGYGVLYSSLFKPTILGKEQPYPQPNFPPTHRLGYSINLVCTPISL